MTWARSSNGVAFAGSSVAQLSTARLLSEVGGVRMLGAERFLVNRQRALVERLGLRIGARGVIQHGEIVERRRRCPDARGRAPSRGSPARAGRAARPWRRRRWRRYSPARLLSDGGGVRMLGAERLLADRQRALVERLGLGVGAGGSVQHGEIVERAWRCPDARGRAPSRGSPARAGRAARPSRRRPWRRYSTARLLSAGGGVRMLGAERLLADRQRALVERLGLRVGARGVVQHGEIVERRWRCPDARGRAPSRGSPARAGRAARPSRRRRWREYSAARLLSEVAVSGCSGPSAFSRIASAR